MEVSQRMAHPQRRCSLLEKILKILEKGVDTNPFLLYYVITVKVCKEHELQIGQVQEESALFGRDFTTHEPRCQEFFANLHKFCTFIPKPANCGGIVETAKTY